MDFGLDPFHAAPSLAGGEGPEDASAAVAFLEAGRVSAFLRHGLYDGADDAEEESVGEIGEEGARGVFSLTLSAWIISLVFAKVRSFP